jgi:hypothetical protein
MQELAAAAAVTLQKIAVGSSAGRRWKRAFPMVPVLVTAMASFFDVIVRGSIHTSCNETATALPHCLQNHTFFLEPRSLAVYPVLTFSLFVERVGCVARNAFVHSVPVRTAEVENDARGKTFSIRREAARTLAQTTVFYACAANQTTFKLILANMINRDEPLVDTCLSSDTASARKKPTAVALETHAAFLIANLAERSSAESAVI